MHLKLRKLTQKGQLFLSVLIFEMNLQRCRCEARSAKTICSNIFFTLAKTH